SFQFFRWWQPLSGNLCNLVSAFIVKRFLVFVRRFITPFHSPSSHDDIASAGALAVAVLVTAAVAGALDRLVLQRVGGTDPHAAHVQTIVTIGIDIVWSPTWPGGSAVTCCRSATPGASTG
ncbi:hypothetical protein LV779_25870, partial [Streptomyces thinghirensis]|nr:hypothetical protein [Streptomyces thinghirensis]